MSPADRDATPILRRGFDAVEREVAPRLESLVRSEQFAIAAGLASRMQTTVQRQISRSTRRFLHLINLPAGTDVSRILNEIGQLNKRVDQLSKQLQSKEAQRDATTNRPARSSRTRAS